MMKCRQISQNFSSFVGKKSTEHFGDRTQKFPVEGRSLFVTPLHNVGHFHTNILGYRIKLWQYLRKKTYQKNF